MSLTKPTGAMLNAGSTSAPQALGTAAAGTSQSYSRADHVHAMPSAGDVGAIPTSQLGSLATTAQVAAITPASIGAIPTSAQSGFATLTGGHLTTSQIPALGGDITLAAGAVSAQVVALQGSAIAATTPTSGQVLAWNGTQWAPATASTGGGGGANGLTYYLNQGTAADAPTTNIPATPHQLGRTGETGQTTVTTGTLTQNTWVLVAGFVSESSPVDPATTTVPAGLWDFNVWAYGNANAQAGTSIRAVAYIYNGTTLTLLGTSGGQVINNSSAQYSLSVLVAQTTVLLTDRIYIAIEAYATGNNHNVTAQFGDGTPSHVHTSLPLVGGTGLWKNSSGVLQSPATLLVDADVDAAANIAYSKLSGVQSALSSTAPLALVAGGTGSTSQLGALTALGAQPALTTTSPLALTLGGTGETTQQAALNAISGAQTTGYHFRSDGTNVSLQPMSLADVTAGTLGVIYGGTGGTNGDDAINNLGFPAQIRPVVSNVNLGTGTTASYVFTSGTTTPSFVAHSILTAGDNILCSSASNSMNLGPWVVTTTGYQAVFVGTLASGSTSLNINSVTSGIVAVGQTIVIPNSTNTVTIASFGTFNGTSGIVNISASIITTQSNVTMASGTGIAPVYTRPAWFRGTLLTSAYYFQTIRSSSAANGQGNVYSIYPTLASESLPSVTANASGGTAWSNSLVSQRSANATTSSNTFSGRQTLWAGSAGGNIPFAFQAGAITTTPVAHSVEWDGTNEYVTTGATFAGSIATTVLTVTGTPTGVIQVGMLITGAGVTAGTTITALGTGTGGAGTYIVSASQTVSSTTITGQIRCIKATFINGAAGGTGAVPATATAVGRPGQMAFDANYMYICTANNTWKKTALVTV